MVKIIEQHFQTWSSFLLHKRSLPSAGPRRAGGRCLAAAAAQQGRGRRWVPAAARWHGDWCVGWPQRALVQESCLAGMEGRAWEERKLSVNLISN